MQVPPFSLSQQIEDLGVDLEETVLEVLRSGQYIGGAQIKRFEEAFATSVGCEHAVGCNSATEAWLGLADDVFSAAPKEVALFTKRLHPARDENIVAAVVCRSRERFRKEGGIHTFHVGQRAKEPSPYGWT